MSPATNKPNSTLTSAPAASKRQLVRAIVLLVGVLIAAGVIVGQQNAIFDYLRLHGYHAPAAVAKLADDDSMNRYTRHLFYLNKPQLLPTVASFRHYCPENKDTVVLGCYHSGQNGIFIYNVQESSLAGVQQVTAAHEVLHSVYARLSRHDRAQLNADLMDYYHHGLTDNQVKNEVKIYQDTEPNDVLDEMSCTFGTEIAKLPPNLEAYYKRYFDDRSKIVGYEQRYEAQFTQRQAAIKADDQQLATLKAGIDELKSSLISQQSQINAQRTRLNGYITANNISAYNAEVPGFNGLIATYNAGVNTLEARIASYNQQVNVRNDIAGQLTELDQALDTRTVPAVSH